MKKKKTILPSINLIDYKIIKFSYKANENFAQSECGISHSGNISIDDSKLFNAESDERYYKLDLSIKVTPTIKTPGPYSLFLSMYGIFKVEDDVPKESRGAIVRRNGSSILYGAAREYIFMTLCHGLHGSLLLPTTSFMLTPQDEKKE